MPALAVTSRTKVAKLAADGLGRAGFRGLVPDSEHSALAPVPALAVTSRTKVAKLAADGLGRAGFRGLVPDDGTASGAYER